MQHSQDLNSELLSATPQCLNYTFIFFFVFPAVLGHVATIGKNEKQVQIHEQMGDQPWLISGG